MNNKGAWTNTNCSAKQSGVATIEFAVGGLATLIVLFTAIEMGRFMFTMNALSEVTRRGARVAAVCTVDNSRIKEIASFDPAISGTRPVVKGLTTGNIAVEYLGAAGNVIANAASSEAAFLNIRYVRVRVVNYQYTWIVPGLNLSFTAPEFPTVLPRESLGVPRPGQISTCA